jgi:predicted AAA+ superfamily ATPase
LRQPVLGKKGIPLYYYDKKSRAELDFVFCDGEHLSVVEVKSGNDYRRHAALDNAIRDNPKAFGRKIVLRKGNVEADGDILYLPLFVAALL